MNIAPPPPPPQLSIFLRHWLLSNCFQTDSKISIESFSECTCLCQCYMRQCHMLYAGHTNHTITNVNPNFVQYTDNVLESAGFLLHLSQRSASEDQMLAVLNVHTLQSNENIHCRILYGFHLRKNIAFA